MIEGRCDGSHGHRNVDNGREKHCVIKMTLSSDQNFVTMSGEHSMRIVKDNDSNFLAAPPA